MELISSQLGAVALRLPGDDVRPRRGVLVREIVDVIATHYQFSVKPTLPPGVAPFLLPLLGFQSGEVVINGNKIPIVGMSISAQGVTIASVDTDLAEQALQDLLVILRDSLGFQMEKAPNTRSYASDIIMEFNPSLESMMALFPKIAEFLNKEINRPKYPFKIKSMSFGYGDPPNRRGIPTPETIEKTDFTIERRAGEPYDRNRYYCGAPVSTSEHIRILQAFESLMLGSG